MLRYSAENGYKLQGSSYAEQGREYLRHIWRQAAEEYGMELVDADMLREQKERSRRRLLGL